MKILSKLRDQINRLEIAQCKRELAKLAIQLDRAYMLRDKDEIIMLRLDRIDVLKDLARL